MIPTAIAEPKRRDLSMAASASGSFASSGFSDYAGWNTFDGYWKTIRMPDLDGNGHADVCGRSSAGIHCAKL